MSDDEQYVCTKEEPWEEGKGRAIHPDAKVQFTESDHFDGSDYDYYLCPNCNKRFAVEIGR